MDFGDKIKFKNHLVRKSDLNKKFWESNVFRYDFKILKRGGFSRTPKITNGIIIGKRTLWNGKILYESVDDGYVKVFIFEEPIEAYLVAIDMKHNPVYILPEDIIF